MAREVKTVLEHLNKSVNRTKNIWDVIKANRQDKNKSYNEFCLEDGNRKILRDLTQVANEFNKYIIDVGMFHEW